MKLNHVYGQKTSGNLGMPLGRSSMPWMATEWTKRVSYGLWIGLISLTLTGCSGEMTGQLVGGSMGALLGSQIGQGNGKILATALGAVAGMALGGALGKKFDQEDKRRAEQAAQQAACTGERVEWRNESTKASGTWYPGPIQRGPQNRSCRWLECLATDSDGQPQKLTIYAEQQPDGSWLACSPPDRNRSAPSRQSSRSSYSKPPKNRRYSNQPYPQPYQDEDGQWYQPQQVPYQGRDGRWYVDSAMY